MKLKDIFYFAIAGFSLASCANEAPFSQESNQGEGKFLIHSLTVQVNNDETLVRSSSDAPSLDEFTIAFFNTEKINGKPVRKFPYSDRPEVVTLPVGSYVIKASYGGDPEKPFDRPKKDADFNAPYYLGISEAFQIENNKIIDNLDPVVCKLANVKVTINFDMNLVAKMGEDSKVSVTVGTSKPLDFGPSTESSGYFAYVEGSSTLAASFSGKVDGDFTEETKTYDNVKPGTHYNITFKLHLIDPHEPGIINPGDEGEEIKVDAVVNLEDKTGEYGDVTPEEEFYLIDDRYPSDEPTPVVPDDPVSDEAPSIKAENPVDLDKVNKGADLTSCVINIHSYAEGGITKFECDIQSNSLTPEELAGVGLASHLDLVNTDESLAESLSFLGFPVNVGGKKEVQIDITSFMPLLGALGPGKHDFVLTVEDANGETTKTLSIEF